MSKDTSQIMTRHLDLYTCKVFIHALIGRLPNTGKQKLHIVQAVEISSESIPLKPQTFCTRK